MDEPDFRRLIAVDRPLGGDGRIDADLVAHRNGTQSSSFRANRTEFQLLLRKGLDVRWSHALANLRTKRNSVELRTRNGDVFKSKIVIGADGRNSKTRRTLLPRVESKSLANSGLS